MVQRKDTMRQLTMAGLRWAGMLKMAYGKPPKEKTMKDASLERFAMLEFDVSEEVMEGTAEWPATGLEPRGDT